MVWAMAASGDKKKWNQGHDSYRFALQRGGRKNEFFFIIIVRRKAS
jgi:hypothetical protein